MLCFYYFFRKYEQNVSNASRTECLAIPIDACRFLVAIIEAVGKAAKLGTFCAVIIALLINLNQISMV